MTHNLLGESIHQDEMGIPNCPEAIMLSDVNMNYGMTEPARNSRRSGIDFPQYARECEHSLPVTTSETLWNLSMHANAVSFSRQAIHCCNVASKT